MAKRHSLISPASNAFAIFALVALLTLQFSDSGFAQRAGAQANHNRALQLYRAGKYAEATPLAEQAAEMAKNQNEEGYATALNLVGILYKLQGRYGTAEEVHKRALAIRERRFGPDHPTVAESANNLAEVYKYPGPFTFLLDIHGFSTLNFRICIHLVSPRVGVEWPRCIAEPGNCQAVKLARPGVCPTG